MKPKILIGIISGDQQIWFDGNTWNHYNQIPAGLFTGIECFWSNNEKWILRDGIRMRFDDAPLKIRNMIVDAFFNDKPAQDYLKKIGITAFSEGFEFWYRCRVGALDNTPDFSEDGKFTPDYFNNSCTNYSCPHRGRFCSVAAGLKNYEVESLAELKNGFTIEEAAANVCVSAAGMRSRIEKLKIKMDARNMPHLVAKAVEMGI